MGSARAETAQPKLSLRQWRCLQLQWLCARSLGRWLLWPLAVAWMRVVRGYRIRDLGAARRRFRELRLQSPGPLLVCPNHLTWIDSLLVQWALVPPWVGWGGSRLLAWNIPEKSNFAQTLPLRVICYVGKCLPIERGGDRGAQKIVLGKVRHLMEHREMVLVFPEGTRSRSGHIDPDEISYGVGGMVDEVPGCKVLCVYLRGDGQQQMSVLPQRGERFGVELQLLEPSSEAHGRRRHRDLARQVARELCAMEQRYLASR